MHKPKTKPIYTNYYQFITLAGLYKFQPAETSTLIVIPVGVVPLGDLVIVSQQPQPVVGVGGALAAVAALTHPLYQVDVGGAGHPATRHRDVAPGPGHQPGRVQRAWAEMSEGYLGL